MSWQTWSLFLIVSVTMSLSPGPAVLYVISRGLAGGSGGALGAAAGILVANVLFFALTGTGLDIVLSRFPVIFPASRWIGAGFLLWLGVSTFVRVATRTTEPAVPQAEHWKVAANGVALQLSNPKAILFFVVILPPFLSASAAFIPQLVILAATDVIAEFFILMAYGSLGAWLASIARDQRSLRWLDRISGLVLCAVALAVLLSSR